VPVANVEREIKTVSQPTKSKYERRPGTTFPLRPKILLDKTRVGAFERLPASELRATTRKERIVPMRAAKEVCQKDIPKPKKKEPYESANSETFAPHHGQKRSGLFHGVRALGSH
jgi:hypothetical protein